MEQASALQNANLRFIGNDNNQRGQNANLRFIVNDNNERGLQSQIKILRRILSCGLALNQHEWTHYDKSTIIILWLRWRSVTSPTRTPDAFFFRHSVINTTLLRVIRCLNRSERNYHFQQNQRRLVRKSGMHSNANPYNDGLISVSRELLRGYGKKIKRKFE